MKRWIAILMSLLMVLSAAVPAETIQSFAAEDNVAETVELLTNGDFSDVNTEANTAENWGFYTTGASSYQVDSGSVTFNIKELGGADWANYLKSNQTITMEAGKDYQISFTVTSSASRSIQVGLDGDRNNSKVVRLTKGQTENVSFTMNLASAATNNFIFFLGQIGEETLDEIGGEHTITLSDIRVLGPSGDTGNGSEGGNTSPGLDSVTGYDEIPEVEGNLLTNGNFADGASGWNTYTTNAEMAYKPYCAAFNITGYGADWQQGLYQTVSVEAGTTYSVSFDVESTVARNVTAGFDPTRWEVKAVPANEKTTVTYTVTPNATGNQNFFIYLGNCADSHVIKISNVSITAQPASFEGVDENDAEPAPLTSIAGLAASDASVIRDGSFTNGLSCWTTYAVDWMAQYDVVKYTKTDDGMQVYITNTGGDAGNNAYDVQLNQKITMKAGINYTLSFDVSSQKARCINVVLIDDNNDTVLAKKVAVQAGENKHVTYQVPVQTTDRTLTFSIQMGKVDGDVQQNTLTFSNIKMEQFGYSDLAVLIDDGNFTDGQGRFTAEAKGQSSVTVSDKCVTFAVQGSSIPDDAVLVRGGLALEAGTAYELSFVAGAVLKQGEASRTVKAVLVDGSGNELAGQTFSLTSEAEVYTLDYTPKTSVANASVKIMAGGTDGTVYVDTVRLDAAGYAEALGINRKAHDITGLTKKQSPVISEDAVNNLADQPITLTFVDNEEYRSAITAVLVDGKQVDYTVSQGKIVIPAEAFDLGQAKSKTFTISVEAYWYTTSMVYQTIYAEKQWELSWSDEFNGNTLDMTKWSYQNGTGAEYGLDGWGNNEQQYYTDENISVGDGALTIEAKKEAREGKTYTSGRIWSMNDDKTTPKFSQTYGKFEAKMKLPGGSGYEGIWPAFWLLPVSSEYGGWPLSGEIDIMEARGREANKVDGTIHYGKPWPNNASQGGSYVWEDDEDAITGYHIYSLEWEPSELRWYVDGKLYYTATNWYSQSDDNPVRYAYGAPFDQEFYIILNMAVGGAYDGNLTPDDSVLPTNMQVDYVRVYTSAEEYGEAVEPEIVKEEIPADAKTSFNDVNFEQIKVVADDTTAQNPDGWNLVTLPAYNGAASVSTVEEDGTTLAKLDIASGGGYAYSVQLIQQISLIKGRYYKLSFDAKADKNRSISVKLGDIGDSGWGTYATFSTELVKELNHYEYVFQMINATDLTSRLEINAGLSNTNVYVGNIIIEEVEDATVDEDCQKKPLRNGYQIYNGTFDLGDITRLTYWHTDGAVEGKVIKDDSLGYVFTMTAGENDAVLYQNGIELLQSDTYQLTFDAKSADAQTVTVSFTSEDGSIIYASEDVALSGTMGSHTLQFTMPEGVTDKNAVVKFITSSGTVVMDNMVLTRETSNNMDFTGLNAYPLFNGDFEAGNLGWSTYGGTSLNVVTDGDNHFGTAAAQVGGNLWDALLMYSDLNLHAGYIYEFSFRAKASSGSHTFDVCMEDVNYSRSFAQSNVEVTEEWQTYRYTFKLSEDKENLTLKYLLAGADSAYTFMLDDVVLKIKGAPESVGTLTDTSAYHKAGEDVVLNYYSQGADWTEKASLYVNDILVPAAQVTIVNGTVTLDASVFDGEGKYTISAKADGMVDSNTVTVNVYPANGSRILNGSFADGLESWSTWCDSNCANYVTGNDFLGISSLYGEGFGWNAGYGNYVQWAIQLAQSNVPVTAGTEYVLAFTAASSADKTINIEGLASGWTEVNITEGVNDYVVRFTPTADTLNLNIMAGIVSEDDIRVFDLFFDNIVLMNSADYEKAEKQSTQLGTKLPAPAQAAVRTAGNASVISITPAADVPSGVSYEITVNGEKAAVIRDLSYTYTGTADTVSIRTIYPTAYLPSDSVNAEVVSKTATVIYKNGSTVVDTISADSDGNAALSSAVMEGDGKLFLGWFTEDVGTVDEVTSELTAKAFVPTGVVTDMTVYAGWLDIGTGASGKLYLEGVQFRSKSENVTAGVRFVTRISKSLIASVEALNAGNEGLKPESSEDKGIGYGTVLTTRSRLAAQMLVKDAAAKYVNQGMVVCPAVNIYGETAENIQYTAVITGISVADYDTQLAARPYLTYYDINGTEQTYYVTESSDNTEHAQGGAYCVSYREALEALQQ